jgi:SAM-dependent methyltransferase
MSHELTHSPQHAQMTDPSMLRTLRHQVDAIWPLERPLLAHIAPPSSVLDVGCGPGFFLAELAGLWPHTHLVGIDIATEHLERLPPGIEGRQGDALDAVSDAGRYDLVVCRHVLQAVPQPERVVRRLAEAARPGGLVHVVAEDYGLIGFSDPAVDDFWQRTAIAFGRATGTDNCGGRRAAVWMWEAGLTDVVVRWLALDVDSIGRERFAAIWEAWRDGYSDAVSDRLGLSRAETREDWERMLTVLRDPRGYAVWHLPVIQGRRSQETR